MKYEKSMALYLLVVLSLLHLVSPAKYTYLDRIQWKNIFPQKCKPLKNDSLCYGVKIPFKYTTFYYSGLKNEVDTWQALNTWSGLRFSPSCWFVIQPFLCSIYLPECDSNSSSVQLPSKDLCNRVFSECPIVLASDRWPRLPHCREPYFTSPGHTVYDTLMFNKTGECLPPLVATPKKENWYRYIAGCGRPWMSPFYSRGRHKLVHIIIAVLGSVSLMSTIFTVMTYLTDWKRSGRYPCVILFYVNMCFGIATFGWLAQFFNIRQDILGQKDGTQRIGEPMIGSGETVTCVIVFVIVYYFSMAACVWFVTFAYARHISFQALNSPRDALSGKTAYFHIVSWCLPLILTVIALFSKMVDGDSMAGICFISERNVAARLCLLILPLICIFTVTANFLIKAMQTLDDVRQDTPVNDISFKAVHKIKNNLIRMGTFVGASSLVMFLMMSFHIYSFAFHPAWELSFLDFFICESLKRTSAGNSTCHMTSSPNSSVAVFNIVLYFVTVLLMGSWAWTPSSLRMWKKFFDRLRKRQQEDVPHSKKHHMIAKAFKDRIRRKNKDGHISISFCSTHDDPLGMNIELQSGSMYEISSFTAAMPVLMHRRGGVAVAGGTRHYSDSDVGSSIGSRRNSIDSQASTLHAICIGPESSESKLSIGQSGSKGRKHGKNDRRFQPVLFAVTPRSVTPTVSSNDGHEKLEMGIISKQLSMSDLPTSTSSITPSSLKIYPAKGYKPQSIEFTGLGTKSPSITIDVPKVKSRSIFTRSQPIQLPKCYQPLAKDEKITDHCDDCSDDFADTATSTLN